MRLSKRSIDALKRAPNEFSVWDSAVPGFGVRVRPTGAKSFIVLYRAGIGRGAPVRRFTIAAVGKLTAEQARDRARIVLGAVANDYDPARQKTEERAFPTVAELADQFLSNHVRVKLKPHTAEFYSDILERLVKPTFGTTKSDKLSRLQLAKLHSSLHQTPFQANRMLTVVGSMYSFACHAGVVPEGLSPVKGIAKFKENRRERFLTTGELERLGHALRTAEKTGIPWNVDEQKVGAKHVPKTSRTTKIDPNAAAAIRLLLFTGCRLSEILHLRWDYVDFERGCLFLPDSKTGRKTIILNAPALAVLNSIKRGSPYVVPGSDPQKPRHDLKRPWAAVTLQARLSGVRLHDLRHTYASFGAGSGLGLPIIGRLLGHAHVATTARYAHLDSDPLRRASESIAGQIAAAMNSENFTEIVPTRSST
ncbi:MAG: tyrosine-type recombinase/integrase [Xanthobacteraceae bacterium]|nr:tyrosine-type recombinase/integrase [Xanthobacteraceae bacterium]